MSQLANCWEVHKCGREVNGAKVKEYGVCPAAIFEASDGFCGGKNAGRACTYVAGTFCSGIVQGTHREKAKRCGECDFYRLLKQEHGAEMTFLRFDRYIKQDTGQEAS